MSKINLVVIIAAIASIVAFLDGSIVNVALPAIAKEFSAGFVTQQWVVDAYLITLGAFMLAAGALSDIYGRKRIMQVGLVWFGVSSLLCAAAPTSEFLIIARAIQGVGGALLVPSSLALIMSYIPADKRSHAIGRWTALTGIAQLVGPVLGGLFVDYLNWRYVFVINIVPIVLTMILLTKLDVKELRDESKSLDIGGAALGSVGLGGVVYGLIEQSNLGWSHPAIYSTLILGGLCLLGFIWNEKHSERPMMPLSLFKVRNFSVGNLTTLMVYAALGIAVFVVSIFVQQVGGYSATAAGLTMLPVTIIMILLASRFGSLAGRFGPRVFMSLGPIISGIGFLTMLNVNESVKYLTTLLPGVLLFGLGLSMTVAPLTAAVLSSISNRQSGVGSAVNNAISRIAGLVAVALLGSVVGQSLGLDGFRNSVVFAAILLFVGGIVSAIGIVNPGKLLRRSVETK